MGSVCGFGDSCGLALAAGTLGLGLSGGLGLAPRDSDGLGDVRGLEIEDVLPSAESLDGFL